MAGAAPEGARLVGSYGLVADAGAGEAAVSLAAACDVAVVVCHGGEVEGSVLLVGGRGELSVDEQPEADMCLLLLNCQCAGRRVGTVLVVKVLVVYRLPSRRNRGARPDISDDSWFIRMEEKEWSDL